MNRQQLRPCVESLEHRALLASGDLDTSFGTGGEVRTYVTTGSENVRGLRLQVDGKILAFGSADTFPTGGFEPVVVRYNTDGSLDSTFGSGGIASAAVNVYAGVGIAIQPSDGRIVVAGANLGNGGQFGLTRFLGDSPSAPAHVSPTAVSASSVTAELFDPTLVSLVLDNTDFWTNLLPRKRSRQA